MAPSFKQGITTETEGRKAGFLAFLPKLDKKVQNIIIIFDKKYLVAHGHQFKYAGGIGGIFPSMLRWFSGMAKTLGVETAFIGHYHQSIFTKRVIVNGSSKGYDAYALGKNLEYEKPSQKRKRKKTESRVRRQKDERKQKMKKRSIFNNEKNSSDK